MLLGGDVNCTIIFEELGITTHSVGQIDTSTLRSFSAAAGSFDLFVEDELHELDANLKALYVALELVVGGAWVVIEDINPALKQTWLAVATYLEIDYCC